MKNYTHFRELKKIIKQHKWNVLFQMTTVLGAVWFGIFFAPTWSSWWWFAFNGYFVHILGKINVFIIHSPRGKQQIRLRAKRWHGKIIVWPSIEMKKTKTRRPYKGRITIEMVKKQFEYNGVTMIIITLNTLFFYFILIKKIIVNLLCLTF